MKQKYLAVFLALVLTASLALTACGSQSQIQAAPLMEGVDVQRAEAVADLTGPEAAILTDFGVRLLQGTVKEGENTLVSPLSVLTALGMTANGAEGETLAQMEAAFGMPIQDLNQYLSAYTQALPQGKAYKLNAANSIWLKDDGSIQVEEEFLETNAAWYDAGIYQAPFDDSTLRDINTWVSENTDGMIDSILDQIPDDAVMYLVNALAFDAQWEDIYEETQVREGIFTTEDGTARTVDFLWSEEQTYMEDDLATGFWKYYKDSGYAFAALLPKEDVSLREYADSLTGERLRALLTGTERAAVTVAIPKFETEYSTELSEVLKAMGMADPFDEQAADFSNLGTTDTGLLFINRVLHKTYLALDEQGTRAGAATAVEMATGADEPAEDRKEVLLNRPFLCMIIDQEVCLPVFIGVVTDLEA